jgi:RNA-directed DNA polymerase
LNKTTEDKGIDPEYMEMMIKNGLELHLPLKVSILRWKLGNKAKREPNFRFYALYDRIYRLDVLTTAYDKCRKNDGSPGVDGLSFESIESEEDGKDTYIKGIQTKLKAKTYEPQPVKRVYIPKPDGRMRPLGIPCIEDRVIQTAVLLVIEPIFEQDFKDCSYGFRPGKSAHDALKEVKRGITDGYNMVYDADLASYFDTIDHQLLMEKLERRIADRSVLALIRKWLKSDIIDGEGPNGKQRVTKPKAGTPQGGVISPLLANIYLHDFDKAFCEIVSLPSQQDRARLIRYADDFVVMAREMKESSIKWIKDRIEGDLKLTINGGKTKIVDLNQDGGELNFLGYTFRKDRDLQGRPWKYLNMTPSKKAVKRFRERLDKEVFRTRMTLFEIIAKVNDKTRGWKSYFNIGYPRKACRDINLYLQHKFTIYFRTRSQRKSKIQKEGESQYAALKRCGLQFL